MDKIRSQKFYREESEKTGKGIKSDFEHYQIVIEAAYQKALQTETDQVTEMEFANLYGEDVVQADAQHAQKLRKEFKASDEDKLDNVPFNADPRKLSSALEAIITEQIELNEWFGEGTNTLQTTNFDDIENGIDCIVEFNSEEGRKNLGLAFDTTYAYKTIVKRKVARIAREIKKGELGKIKYFKTTDGSIAGRMKNIPKVILSVERKNAIMLAEAWVEGKQEELQVHPVQLMLLQQIEFQLEGQLNLAQLYDASDIIRSLETQLTLIRRILKEKTQELTIDGIPPRLPKDQNFDDLKIMIQKRYYPKPRKKAA